MANEKSKYPALKAKIFSFRQKDFPLVGFHFFLSYCLSYICFQLHIQKNTAQ